MPSLQAAIVDDETSIRYFLRAALEELDFECTEFSNGVEALAALQDRGFDLMLLDIRMPGLNGLDVLGKIRNRGLTTPVVMVSALGDPEVAEQALTSLGANAFLRKPCSLAEISGTVERVLQSAGVGSRA